MFTIKKIILTAVSAMAVNYISAQNITGETEEQRIERLTTHQENEKRREAKYKKIAELKKKQEKELAKNQNSQNKTHVNPVNPEILPDSLAYFSKQSRLEFTKSEKGLRNWLSTPHPEYNMASWCFYGNVITDEGKPVLFEPGSQRTLSMDQCSESPGGDPFWVQLTNKTDLQVSPTIIVR